MSNGWISRLGTAEASCSDARDWEHLSPSYAGRTWREGRYEMGILGWILLGILAGIIAKALLPGDDPGGFIITTIIGIVGALLGGFIARALGLGDPIDEFFDVSTWLAAIIGAIILLVIYRAVTGRRTVV